MSKQSKKRTHSYDNLHSAMENGSVQEIQTLIDQYADVNELDKDGRSPLVHAASHNRAPKILQALIDAKADPNLRSDDAPATPPEVWAEMLQCGKTCAGFVCGQIRSPLTCATLQESATNVKILIDAKADVNYLNVDEDKSSTVLLLAVEMGSLNIVKLLVEAKAILDVSNQDNYSVLDIAERKGHQRIVKLLRDANAPRGMRSRMQQSCIHGRADEVKSLLDAGYPLHLQHPYSEYPLVLAVEHGRTDIAQMLIAAGAEVNVPNTSLLLTSIKQNNIALVHSLVAAHADVNVWDRVQCPLIYSIEKGDTDLTKALIDARADVDLAPHSHPKTALHLAAERGDINAARLLIDAKANMNHLVDNRTPLALAAENGRLDVMKLLLDAKAPVDGGDGLPLLCATEKGNAEAVQILLDAKASLESRDAYLRSPFVLAISCGHAPVVTALLTAKAPLVSPPRIDDPLTVAAKFDKTDIMKIMIDAKAPLEAAAGKSSPLRIAIDNMKLDAMRVLFEAKAAADIPGTEYGYELLSRALRVAMLYQNDNVLRLLLDTHPSLASEQYSSRCLGTAYQGRHFSALQLMLDKGISADEATVDGVPIFYQAVSDHTTPVVKMMIDAKANVNVRGPQLNDTPLIAASRRRYQDIVELLLEARATLDAKDCNGDTALGHAVNVLDGSPVDESIVQMLTDANAPLE